MKEQDLIKIWNLFDMKRKFLGDFKIKNDQLIKEAIKKGFIKKEKSLPKYCDIDDCNNPLEIINENKQFIILKDIVNPQHIKKIPVKKAYVYEITEKFNKKILDSLFPTNVILNKTEYYDGYYISVNNIKITVIFIHSLNTLDKNLIYLLSRQSMENVPTFIIYNSNVNNEIITEMLRNFPLGYLCVPILLNKDIKIKKLKHRLESFLELHKKLKLIESKVIESISDDDTRILIKNIVSNPQYILSLINRIAINEKTAYKDIDWVYFENLIRTLFSIIYHSKLDMGGIRDSGEEVADTYFLSPRPVSEDETSQIKLVGLVDSKFSRNMDLSQEKTEKYINYISNIKNKLKFPRKIVLIFVYIDEKTRQRTQDLIDRLNPKLNDDQEYIVLLNANSLLILAYLYLSVALDIIKIKTEKEKWLLLKEIFNNEFLKKEKCKLETDNGNIYYELNENKLLDIIRRYIEQEYKIFESYLNLLKL